MKHRDTETVGEQQLVTEKPTMNLAARVDQGSEQHKEPNPVSVPTEQLGEESVRALWQHTQGNELLQSSGVHSSV